MPYTTLVAGTAITASWGNASVRDQVVTPFASSAARGSAITSPVEGMLSTLTDTDMLDYYTGAGWVTIAQAGAWTAWLPTLTNLTLGNGTVTARYRKLGTTVDYRFKFKMGTTSAVGTQPQFTLPWAPLAGHTSGEDLLGAAILQDAGGSIRLGVVWLSVGTTVDIVSFSTTGTNTVTSATVPHTWGVGDSIGCAGTYEAA